METIDKEFHSIRMIDVELENIKGAGFTEWRIAPVEGDPEFTVEQRYIFWGKVATKKLRRD